MEITEQQRLQLAEAAAASLGGDAAATLMELLVPAGDHPATRRDLAMHADRVDDRLTATDERTRERLDAADRRMEERFARMDERMDERFARMDERIGERFARMDEQIDERFARVDERFARVDERFARVDERITALEQRMDDRFETLRADLVGVFRQELVTAVSGQTRAMIMAMATAVFGIGGLAVTLAQVL